MVTKNARCRKVAGFRFFAESAEILRKMAGVLPSAYLIFGVRNP